MEAPEPMQPAAASSGLQRALIGLLKGYRLLLSPWLGSQCRFEPTCSRYAIEALESHGAGRGSYLAARRVLRCHPWCHGGFDPVPAAGRAVRPEPRCPASGSP